VSNKKKWQKSSRGERRWAKHYGWSIPELYRRGGRGIGVKHDGWAAYIAVEFLTSAKSRAWVDSVMAPRENLRPLTPAIFSALLTSHS
jgi:hypothetical protein